MTTLELLKLISAMLGGLALFLSGMSHEQFRDKYEALE